MIYRSSIQTENRSKKVSFIIALRIEGVQISREGHRHPACKKQMNGEGHRSSFLQDSWQKDHYTHCGQRTAHEAACGQFSSRYRSILTVHSLGLPPLKKVHGVQSCVEYLNKLVSYQIFTIRNFSRRTLYCCLPTSIRKSFTTRYVS